MLLAGLVWGQGCTVDKVLDFPNLNLCGFTQGDFCESVDGLSTRVGALEQPQGLCGDTEQALCDTVASLEQAVAAPLSLCGVPEAEFCAALEMSQSTDEAPGVVNPAEIICLASPVGEIKFLRLGGACPCGFVDKTSDYENRYVSIGGATDFIGSVASGAPGALGSRTTTVSGTVSGISSEAQMWATGRAPVTPLLSGTGPFTASGPLSTADVAPSLALMVCEREGACDCDVNA